MENQLTGVVLVGWGEKTDEIAGAIQRLGQYKAIEFANLGPPAGSDPWVSQAVERVLESVVEQVLLVPTLAASYHPEVHTALQHELEQKKAEYPDIEFVLVPAEMDAEQQALFLFSRMQPVTSEKESQKGLVPLSQLPSHAHATVDSLNGGNEFVSRLAALGFIPGAPLFIVHNYGVGPIIVMVRDTRLALGREEASKVHVRATERKHGMRRHFRPSRRHRRRMHFE
jgi:ferrous iron transport protein A